MVKFIHLEQGSSEWLEWRKNKIGSSDIATIMGLNPHCTPYALWSRLIADEHVEVTDRMQRGKDLEPIVRSLMNEKYEVLGCEWIPCCVESLDYPWAITSFDGVCISYEYPMIEIKCPGDKAHGIALMGQVPEIYYPQVQWQLWMGGMEKGLYVSFDGEKCVEVVVHRDEIFIAKMVDAAIDFYHLLINFIPPPMTDKDYVEIVDPEAIEDMEKLKIVERELKYLENHKELLKQRLVKFAGGRNSRIGDTKILKIIRRGNVDYSQIEILKGIDLEQYRKSSTTFWKVT